MSHSHEMHLPNHGFDSAVELREHLTTTHGFAEKDVWSVEGMRHVDAHRECETPGCAKSAKISGKELGIHKDDDGRVGVHLHD